MKEGIRSIGLLAFLFAAMFAVCKAKKEEGCYSSCGNIFNISSPFGLKGDPRKCGDPEYQLSCESNRTVLYIHSNKFWVEAIDYENQTIRIIDSGLQSGNCLSLPHFNMTPHGDPYISPLYRNNIIFVNCSVQMGNDDLYLVTPTCFNSTYGAFIYVLGRRMTLSELHPSCKVIGNVFTMSEMKRVGKSNYREIHDRLMKGFELSWGIPLACRDCVKKGNGCRYYSSRGHLFSTSCSDCRNAFDSWHCKFFRYSSCV